jgi:hypothetical protein
VKGEQEMKRQLSRVFVVFMTAFALALPAFAAEEEGKDETKIRGTIVASPEDPTGKLAPIALQTDKEQFGIANNPLAKKMSKYVGKKAELTGKVQEIDGKKVIEVWLYQRMEDSGKKKKFEQPTG